MFINGMVGVIEVNIQRIIEDRGSFLKRNTMFLEITRSLFLVPLIIHAVEYSIRPLSLSVCLAFGGLTSVFEFAEETREGAGLVVGV